MSQSMAAQPWPRPCGQRQRAVQPAVRLDAVVGERLDVHVARVRPRADAGAVAVGLEERVRAHAARLIRVVESRVEERRDGDVVAPALARLLVAAQAVDPGAAGQAVGEAVPVLVEDDPVLEVAVADARVGRVLADGRRSAPAASGPDRVAVGLRDLDRRDRGRRRRSCAPVVDPDRGARRRCGRGRARLAPGGLARCGLGEVLAARVAAVATAIAPAGMPV